MKKLNCWEAMKCGRENNSKDCYFSEVGTCPASIETFMDGVNDGQNAGRACWVIAGTLCGDDVQGDCSSKIKTCLACVFYHQVRKEQGERFMTGTELAEMTQYKEAILQAKFEQEESE